MRAVHRGQKNLVALARLRLPARQQIPGYRFRTVGKQLYDARRRMQRIALLIVVQRSRPSAPRYRNKGCRAVTPRPTDEPERKRGGRPHQDRQVAARGPTGTRTTSPWSGPRSMWRVPTAIPGVCRPVFRAQPFATHAPLYDLVAAAGSFGPDVTVGTPSDELGWMRVPGHVRLTRDHFVARVEGPLDGAHHPPTARIASSGTDRGGTREGKLVLLWHRGCTDPALGGEFLRQGSTRAPRRRLTPDDADLGDEPGAPRDPPRPPQAGQRALGNERFDRGRSDPELLGDPLQSSFRRARCPRSRSAGICRPEPRRARVQQ